MSERKVPARIKDFDGNLGAALGPRPASLGFCPDSEKPGRDAEHRPHLPVAAIRPGGPRIALWEFCNVAIAALAPSECVNRLFRQGKRPYIERSMRTVLPRGFHRGRRIHARRLARVGQVSQIVGASLTRTRLKARCQVTLIEAPRRRIARSRASSPQAFRAPWLGEL
jgi:hypothetical protein